VIALVTGASSGIGRELARLFARDGHDLVLAARSEERLAALAGELEGRHRVACRVIVSDLAQPGSAARLFEEAGHVDALVNNAGFGSAVPLVDADVEVLTELLEVNVVALTQLTRLALPAMVERGYGYVLNISSTAAFQPGPRAAAYYASKSYVLSFTEAVRLEVEGSGVHVTALCPGATDTGFAERAGSARSRLFSSQVLDAAFVAREGYAGMLAGRGVVIPGAVHHVAARLAQVSPHSLTARFAKRANESAL
jgi:uncharacterized protein